MPKMSLEELIERCLNEDWEYINPCEGFHELEFPDEESKCDGDCINCLLKASGWDKINP